MGAKPAIRLGAQRRHLTSLVRIPEADIGSGRLPQRPTVNRPSHPANGALGQTDQGPSTKLPDPRMVLVTVVSQAVV